MGHCWSALYRTSCKVIATSQSWSARFCSFLGCRFRNQSTTCRNVGFGFLCAICVPIGACWVIVKVIRQFRRGSEPPDDAGSSQFAPLESEHLRVVRQYNATTNNVHGVLEEESKKMGKDSDNGGESVGVDDEANVSDTYNFGNPSLLRDSQQTELVEYPNKNYLFYTNRLASEPDGDFIDIIHTSWCTDYRRLEYHHGFIQWLFPLPEPGVNPLAQVLLDHEIRMIKADKAALDRLLKSYKMMLGFYGFELIDDVTGEVKRAKNWRDRFVNLDRNGHNNLRITRILGCMSLLGFEHLQYPLIKGFLREIVLENTLPGASASCFEFWFETLSESDRDLAWQYTYELEDIKSNKQMQLSSSLRNRAHHNNTVDMWAASSSNAAYQQSDVESIVHFEDTVARAVEYPEGNVKSFYLETSPRFESIVDESVKDDMGDDKQRMGLDHDNKEKAQSTDFIDLISLRHDDVDVNLPFSHVSLSFEKEVEADDVRQAAGYDDSYHEDVHSTEAESKRTRYRNEIKYEGELSESEPDRQKEIVQMDFQHEHDETDTEEVMDWQYR